MTTFEQRQQNYRREAIVHLFLYLFLVRHGRAADAWEIALGTMFLANDIVILQEPENPLLKRVYDCALEVERLLSQVEDERYTVQRISADDVYAQTAAQRLAAYFSEEAG